MINWILLLEGMVFGILFIFLLVNSPNHYKNLKKKDIKSKVEMVGALLFCLVIAIVCIWSGLHSPSAQDNLNQKCEKDLSKCALVNESCIKYQDLAVWCVPDVNGVCQITETQEKYCVRTTKNYRYKTDCEINPREDSLCKCEAYETMLRFTSNINSDVIDMSQEPKIVTECTKVHIRSFKEKCEYLGGEIILSSFCWNSCNDTFKEMCIKRNEKGYPNQWLYEGEWRKIQ